MSEPPVEGGGSKNGTLWGHHGRLKRGDRCEKEIRVQVKLL